MFGQIRDREKHLDNLFEIALVLLGILSAAEFQYFLMKEDAEIHMYVLKVFTVPLVVLIILWLAKELARDEFPPNVTMILTEFCWNLWSFSLFYYLVNIYIGNIIGIALSFTLSIVLIFFVNRAYERDSPTKKGESMYNFYTSYKWRTIRLCVFFLAYGALFAMILPPV